MKRFDFTKYITPVKVYNDSADLQLYLETSISDLVNFVNVPNELLLAISNIFSNQIETYGNLGYNFIPIYLESEEERVKAVIDYWKLLMVRDGQWSTTLNLVNGKIELTDLNSGLVDTTEYGGKEEVEDSKTTTYGKVTDRDNRSTRTSMSENAPINADIETITTPDNKGKVIDDVIATERLSGNDTAIVNRTVDKSGSDKRTYNSPDRYQIYLDILKEYNVYSMVDKIIRTTIYEYNKVS